MDVGMTEREKFFRTRGPWNDPELARMDRIRELLRLSPLDRVRENNRRLKQLKGLRDVGRTP